MPAFETTEYRDHVRRVTATMQARGIDVLLVLSEANLCYLTGYQGYSDYVPQCAVLRAGDADATLILREMDIHCAYPTAYLDESRVEHYPEDHIGTKARTPWEVIGRRVREIAAGGTIGIEYGASVFSHGDHLALAKVLEGARTSDGTGVVEIAKRVKSPAELGYMRQAAAIVDTALTEGIDKIAVGVRECDVAATIMHRLTAGTPDCGGGPAKPVTMGVAHRAAAPHLKWTDAPYRADSQTDFEVGATVNRYTCPLSRTVYLGDPPQRLLDVHAAVMDGFLAGEAAIRAGTTCGDVYRAFAKAFFPHGVRKESRIGYSIGIDWADGGFSLQDDSEHSLEEDSTLHLIVGVWEREEACVFSEAFRVTAGAAERFTSVARELFVR